MTRTKMACCTPSRLNEDGEARTKLDSALNEPPVNVAMVPGGSAFVGTKRPMLKVDGEGVIKRGNVRPFRMDQCAVTNARFADFVADTGYQTDAEKLGNSFVFEGLLASDLSDAPVVSGAPWWRLVQGATWRQPFGGSYEGALLTDHPVVHVTWNDARAFAAWAGGRLPTELEWEQAARAGQGDVPFPWGHEEPDEQSYQPCNIWQGKFPSQDLGLDGYRSTAPARSFEPNPWGLFNMVGNTWEWTADRFSPRSLSKKIQAAHAEKVGFKTLKGGSFLCHHSYCYRYRIAARTGNSPDSSTSHQGFRLVYDL